MAVHVVCSKCLLILRTTLPFGGEWRVVAPASGGRRHVATTATAAAAAARNKHPLAEGGQTYSDDDDDEYIILFVHESRCFCSRRLGKRAPSIDLSMRGRIVLGVHTFFTPRLVFAHVK